MSTLASKNADYTYITPHINKEWRALFILNAYRIVLACSFLIFVYFQRGFVVIGDRYPSFALALILFYLAYSIISALAAVYRFFPFDKLTIAQTSLDIFVLVCLINISTSMISGLGLLINIIIAGASILLPGRMSLFFAALATGLLFTQQIFADVDILFSGRHWFLLALLGSSFFVTAILAHVLAKRIRASEVLLRQHDVDMKNLERLNEHIIQRLHFGVIVVDAKWQVHLINQAARDALDFPKDSPIGHISQLSALLADKLRDWQTNALSHAGPYQTLLSAKLSVSFTPFGAEHSAATLIFLEDIATVSQQAQQLKLASLGRFTSSIAHELRNPLGAISYAVQLLQESQAIGGESQQLIHIIAQQTQRMNSVINNILQLSRRRQTFPKQILLKDWLEDFVRSFAQQFHDKVQIHCDIQPDDFAVHVDTSQLNQVLTNLCENGLHAALNIREQAKLWLKTGYHVKTGEPYLDVIDNGPGVAAEDVEKIFEPFFTTGRKGTGLGLYIANELCQANRASLSYIHQPKAGGCFRITFFKETHYE